MTETQKYLSTAESAGMEQNSKYQKKPCTVSRTELLIILHKLYFLFLEEIRNLNRLLFYSAGRSPRLKCRHCSALRS